LGQSAGAVPVSSCAGLATGATLQAQACRAASRPRQQARHPDIIVEWSVSASQAVSAAHGAAMAIAKVARIELIDGAWPDLLTHLHSYVAPESPGTTRVFALECLGFICEEHVDVADRFPQQETNRMLTSIVQGMAVNQPTEVRHAATRALCDAIEFATMNFERTEERDYLMQMICEATICPDARVRLAAYQNLNKVADLHYKYLEAYIQTIYQLTTQSFNDSDDEVAMQVRLLNTHCLRRVPAQEQTTGGVTRLSCLPESMAQ
jgi:importin subunit beta-1